MNTNTNTTYGLTSFIADVQYGKLGESIFVKDFLEFLRIKYQDVTGVHGFQVIDSDFIVAIGRYEIKANYKDDKQIIIEEYTNVNDLLGSISMGWFYKSKADTLVFLSKETHAMILIPFTEQFKTHYESIKNGFQLVRNKISEHKGRKWQSAFRKIPLSALNGYFAFYKQVPEK